MATRKKKARRKPVETAEEYKRDPTKRGDFESLWQAPFTVTTHQILASGKTPRIYAPKGCCGQPFAVLAPSVGVLVMVWVLKAGEKI